MALYYYVAFVALLASPVWSYSSGAPPKACDGLAPKHGSPSLLSGQTNAAPYKLVGNNKAIVSQPLKVKLTATGDEKIQGFLVQAISDGNAVGEFSPGTSTDLAQTLECAPGQKNTLTHKTIKDKNVSQVDFTWTPSSDLQGKKVKLIATVAANYATFWIKKVELDILVSQ